MQQIYQEQHYQLNGFIFIISYSIDSQLSQIVQEIPKTHIENKNQIRRQNAHSRSIQSTPIQQVQGENRDDTVYDLLDNQFASLLLFQGNKVYDLNIFIIINLKILFLITDFLDFISIIRLFNSSRIFKVNFWRKSTYRAIRSRVMAGLGQSNLDPNSELYQFWNHQVNFDRLENNYSVSVVVFHENQWKFLIQSTEISQILKDIDRTMQEEVFFRNEGNKQKLRNILVALTIVLPKIGYVQGLNQIAGTLLLVGLNEQKSFWLIYYMMKKLNLQSIFQFQRLKFLNFSTAVYLRIFFPELSQLFLSNEIDISYFTTRWFLTLFSYDLPTPLLLKVWNLILMGKWKVLIKVSLAILTFQQKRIIEEQMDMDQLNELLKHNLFDSLQNYEQEQIIGIQESIHISNRLVESLYTIFESSPLTNLEECVFLEKKQSTGKLEFKLRMMEPSRSLAGSFNDLISEVLNGSMQQQFSNQYPSSVHLKRLIEFQKRKVIILQQQYKKYKESQQEFLLKLFPSRASEQNSSKKIQTNQQFISYQQQEMKANGLNQIPRRAYGDQECSFNADDVISLSQLHDEAEYLINHESTTQYFNNFIANSSKTNNQLNQQI